MPEKYEIEIDDRAVLVVVRQYDVAGDEVAISNINVPDRVAEQRDAPVHAEHKCPRCNGRGIVRSTSNSDVKCPMCNGAGIYNRSAGG